MLRQSDPETAAALLAEAQEEVKAKWKRYEQLAKMEYSAD